MTMLRASSEIASAISVWSVLENPHAAASSRPFCRAVTMSLSRSIGMFDSAGTANLRRAFQMREPLFQVQRRFDPVERKTELHHRERNVRLDADDDRLIRHRSPFVAANHHSRARAYAQSGKNQLAINSPAVSM